MNPALRTENLIALMKSLISVLERENAALDRPNVTALDPLIKEKQRLFREYEAMVKAISSQPGFADGLGEDRRAELRTLSERFDEIANINERKLRLTMEATRQVVDTIARAARSAAGYGGYGKEGVKIDNSRQAIPVAVNRQF